MDKSTHEKHLFQQLQTTKKQLKNAVTFLSGDNGIFNVTSSNITFYFQKTISNEDDFSQYTIPPGAYELESLNIEIKRIIMEEEPCTEV